MKKRVFEIIETAKDSDRASKTFDISIVVLIVLTVLFTILESFKNLQSQYHDFFNLFEIFSVCIFTVEYLLRVWTADLRYPNKGFIKSRIVFVFSFLALIDLLAILPFYLPLLIPFDLRFIRIVRIIRITRVFKVNRYSKAMKTIGNVLKLKKAELAASIFVMLFIIIISSILIYHFEHDVQPDHFPNIVASCWWGVATLTTIGYGDIYPITIMGKVLASVIAVCGIGLVALPTGIISSGFAEQMKSNKECICSKCKGSFVEE